MSSSRLHCGDCLREMQNMQNDSVDLVITSPPYEDLRTYGTDFSLQGQAWVDWTVERFMEAIRVCNGLVAFVVEGKTRNFRYSATPMLLMADLHRLGVHLRKPPIYHRVGIPGSGGPDWLRSDTEIIVCATSGGRLPWSDNTACGSPPKYQQGGAMSNRRKDGGRANENLPEGKSGKYALPKLANPGNIIFSKFSECEAISFLEAYCYATNKYPRQVMQELQHAIRKEKISEWCMAVAKIICTTAILQQEMYGGRQSNSPGVGQSKLPWSIQSAADGCFNTLQNVWDAKEPDTAPQRRKSTKQSDSEYRNILSQMPQQPTQEASRSEMQNLWRKEPLSKSLCKALCEMEKAWQSTIKMSEQSPGYPSESGDVVHCKVGGGLMGSRLCHENEAPFPETLAEFFIRSFCPPGGLVLDPFCGSGTTCSVAQKFGRDFIGIDNRQSQIDLTNRRLKESA